MIEEKVLYNMEYEIGLKLIPIMDVMCGGKVGKDRKPERMGNNPQFTHSWWLAGNHKNNRRETNIHFKGVSYVGGDREFGEPSVFSVPPINGSGIRETIDGGPEGYHGTITRGLKTNTEEFSKYNAAVSFSITNTSKIEAKGGIDGIAEANASSETTTVAETSFGQSGGFKYGSVDSISRDIKCDIPPDQSRVLTVDFLRSKEVTPYTETAYADFDIVIDPYDWAGKHGGFLSRSNTFRGSIGCDNWKDLLWFLEGERIAQFPHMGRFLRVLRDQHKHAYECYLWLKNPENRIVSIEGQRTRYYDADTETKWRKA